MNYRKPQTKPDQIPTTAKRWLNTEEVASIYDISLSTQNRWRKENILPFSKIGKVIRYDRLTIDKMFEEHVIGGI